MIVVKTFAQVREITGTPALDVCYSETVASVSALKTYLQQQVSGWQDVFDSGVLTAVNQTLCSDDQLLKDGDEVAFFPPVTGG